MVNLDSASKCFEIPNVFSHVCMYNVLYKLTSHIVYICMLLVELTHADIVRLRIQIYIHSF